MELDEQFVLDTIKAIVNNPNDVKTTRTIDERGVLISLDVNPADMGYVIGRQGQTARSVRTLLKIVGAKNNARVNLKINEPEGGRGPNPHSSSMGGGMGMGSSMGQAPMSTSATMSQVDTSAIDNLDI